MATTILLRTIGGVDDKKAVLSNSQLARTLFIGNTWSKLRIGMRWALGSDPGAAFSGIKFGMGVCSGLTNLFGDATTTNFFGIGPSVYATGETSTRAAGPPPSHSWSHFISKRIGSTFTGGSGTSSHIFADPANIRTVFMLDITKGSPNFTAQLFSRNVNTSPADISLATFLAQMEAPIPAIANHAQSSALTLAMDESAGALNSVNLSWGLTTPTIEISEIAVARLA